jgi:hypothetical protein
MYVGNVLTISVALLSRKISVGKEWLHWHLLERHRASLVACTRTGWSSLIPSSAGRPIGQSTSIIYAKLNDNPVPGLQCLGNPVETPFTRELGTGLAQFSQRAGCTYRSCRTSSISRVVDERPVTERVLEKLSPSFCAVVPSVWSGGRVSGHPNSRYFRISSSLSHALR